MMRCGDKMVDAQWFQLSCRKAILRGKRFADLVGNCHGSQSYEDIHPRTFGCASFRVRVPDRVKFQVMEFFLLTHRSREQACKFVWRCRYTNPSLPTAPASYHRHDTGRSPAGFHCKCRYLRRERESFRITRIHRAKERVAPWNFLRRGLISFRWSSANVRHATIFSSSTHSHAFVFGFLV